MFEILGMHRIHNIHGPHATDNMIICIKQDTLIHFLLKIDPSATFIKKNITLSTSRSGLFFNFIIDNCFCVLENQIKVPNRNPGDCLYVMSCHILEYNNNMYIISS